MENLNHVEHVQFFSKTCRGPEVTITFMVLLDNLRLISRYEETGYYGQSFHNIKWWIIWVTNMDGFMMFYERICLSVYHPYHGKIVWKGFPVHFATIVWPNWMVLKVLIHYYPYHWDEMPLRMSCFPTFPFPIGPNFPETRPVHQMILNPWWQSTAAAAAALCVCVWMS